MLVGVKNDIHRYQMVLKALINISRLDQIGYQDAG
jgi:ABC-type Zn uptake system ZnuABC Zn-binding protein ZnuA